MTKADKEPDWNRWHDLRDIRAKRALTPAESAEYDRFVAIVDRLDAEEATRCDKVLDKLVGHSRRE